MPEWVWLHNYERHEHRGVIYFVTGGGGAHAYAIERAATDLFRDTNINYHYLLLDVDHSRLTVTMNQLDLSSGSPRWTQPDQASVMVKAAVPSETIAEK